MNRDESIRKALRLSKPYTPQSSEAIEKIVDSLEDIDEADKARAYTELIGMLANRLSRIV